VAESSIRDVDEIFDLRVLLEGYGARQAAGRRAEADLGELGELCDRMEAIVAAGEDFGDLTDLNLRFHRAVHEASGVERLVAMVAGLMVTPLVRETFRHYRADELTRSMAQHRELVEALTARDAAWAESVMSAHLHAAKASLRLQLQVPQPAVSDPG
jgi:DNA-binding GntR family transcriptional regulator